MYKSKSEPFKLDLVAKLNTKMKFVVLKVVILFVCLGQVNFQDCVICNR